MKTKLYIINLIILLVATKTQIQPMQDRSYGKTILRLDTCINSSQELVDINNLINKYSQTQEIDLDKRVIQASYDIDSAKTKISAGILTLVSTPILITSTQIPEKSHRLVGIDFISPATKLISNGVAIVAALGLGTYGLFKYRESIKDKLRDKHEQRLLEILLTELQKLRDKIFNLETQQNTQKEALESLSQEIDRRIEKLVKEFSNAWKETTAINTDTQITVDQLQDIQQNLNKNLQLAIQKLNKLHEQVNLILQKNNLKS